MISRRLLVVLLVFSFFFSATGIAFKPAQAKTESKAPSLESVQKSLESTSGYFTENKGQWDSSILFIGRTPFGKVAFTRNAVYYQMIKSEKAVPTKTVSRVVKLSFVNPLRATVLGYDALPQYNNYFIGNDPTKWATLCRNFTKVTYQDVWKGIDLAYFFTPKGMKYEYYVKPEAEINRLQLLVEGADPVNLGKTLQIKTDVGTIQDANLQVFDQVTHQTISSRFAVHEQKISFEGIPANRKNTIVIDPLVYSTYLGGIGYDTGYAITVDSSGNAYVAGSTESTDFPTTSGFDTTFGGEEDVFVTKLNPTGTALIYSTYLGGQRFDHANAICLDNSGNIYITGGTWSSDYPVTPGAFDTIRNKNTECFVTKLNPSGTTLIYSTYLGRSNTDEGFGIAVDGSYNAYVTGHTKSNDFPVTPGAFDTTFNGIEDVFVTKLNPTGAALVYSTYLGGHGDETGSAIAIDVSGNTYITGFTWSTDYPTTTGAYDNFYDDDVDCFVTKLNPSGAALVYSTYLGGSSKDTGYGIALDGSGNAYIAGATYSANFPTTPGAFDTTPIIGFDADYFVTKLNSTGSSLDYSTYLGGSATEYPYSCGIQVDGSGNVYIVGSTWSSDFPVTPGAVDSSYNAESDVFVSKLNAAGSNLLYSTYLGGEDEERGFGIALDSYGNVYVTGYTNSNEFPTTTGAYDTSHNGTDQNDDVFVTKLQLNTIEKVILPILELSIWTNKGEFCTGEEVLYQVTVFNQSAGAAKDVQFTATFPREILYLSADKYRGEVNPSGSVVFYLGSLEGKSSVTFQINAFVAGSVPFEKSTATLFAVTCEEKSTDQKVINLVLKKCGGGSSLLDILVRFKNISYDPVSGEIYLLQSEELVLELEFTGFMTPLSYIIQWGDGTTDKMEKQTETNYLLKHKFSSKGKMVIQIKATDASGRTKTATLNLTVK